MEVLVTDTSNANNFQVVLLSTCRFSLQISQELTIVFLTTGRFRRYTNILRTESILNKQNTWMMLAENMESYDAPNKDLQYEDDNFAMICMHRIQMINTGFDLVCNFTSVDAVPPCSLSVTNCFHQVFFHRRITLKLEKSLSAIICVGGGAVTISASSRMIGGWHCMVWWKQSFRERPILSTSRREWKKAFLF